MRVWKDKVKKLEKTVKKDKETRKEQIERIKKTEEENKKYGEELDTLIQKKKHALADDKRPEKVDMDVLQYEKEQLKMEFFEEEKRQKVETKLLEKRLQELNGNAEELRNELKEKEQEYRISNYKLNELRRTVKHN